MAENRRQCMSAAMSAFGVRLAPLLIFGSSRAGTGDTPEVSDLSAGKPKRCNQGEVGRLNVPAVH